MVVDPLSLVEHPVDSLAAPLLVGGAVTLHTDGAPSQQALHPLKQLRLVVGRRGDVMSGTRLLIPIGDHLADARRSRLGELLPRPTE
ncbi:hypothetical protein [Mycobacterium simiae]|uniref:hypothetical protein n=1 Tax=Mycobacterium simiae TaxID=1784 RepID=UPI00260E7925|nr:hypothetical protein [Mycobacterium simiae]